MKLILICREFHWSFEEYMNTPELIIDSIFTMLQEEAGADRERNKKPSDW